MKMRVSIARALAAKPKLLLMDEPFAALDEPTRQSLNDDLLKLWREDGLTVIFVTHSVYESTYLSTRVVVMTPRPGRITADIALDFPPDRARSLPSFARVFERRRESLGCLARSARMNRILQYATPVILGILVLAIWEFVVRHFDIPPYVLPAPLAIGAAFADNFSSLMASLWTTLQVTLEAFALAVAGGVALAILFSQNKAVENALYPYAVVLQVTPVVAIAPLDSDLGWIRAHQSCTRYYRFHRGVLPDPVEHDVGPALDRSQSDRSLSPLRCLALADSCQLQLPSALPYLLGAMKISGGLALIGAVVAEFVAGSGTASGLAWRIVEAGNRLEIAKMFAALGLLAALGIVIFSILTLVEWALLHRWHESALKKEG